MLASAIVALLASSATAGPLGSGVNLPVWPISQVKIKAEDLQQISTAGFNHVRLPVDLHRLLDSHRRLDRQQVSELQQQILAARRSGLMVIVDVHPPAAFKNKVTSGDQTDVFLRAWEALAEELKDMDSSVIFEILNEPGHTSYNTWWDIQRNAIQIIRRSNPTRILVASAPGFSTVEDLIVQQPYADPNVMYAFHFYRPEKFTHQGAAYSSWYRDSGNIPYPGLDWDRHRIEAEFDKVKRWSDTHKVRAICTEFGVYVPGPVKPQERLAYFADVSRGLRARGIDWTIWKYTGDFGLAPGEPRRLDRDAVRALGLGQVVKAARR